MGGRRRAGERAVSAGPRGLEEHCWLCSMGHSATKKMHKGPAMGLGNSPQGLTRRYQDLVSGLERWRDSSSRPGATMFVVMGVQS